MESVGAQSKTGLQELADVFLSMIPSMKLYTEYVNKFSNALQTLANSVNRNPAVSKLVKVFD